MDFVDRCSGYLFPEGTYAMKWRNKTAQAFRPGKAALEFTLKGRSNQLGDNVAPYSRESRHAWVETRGFGRPFRAGAITNVRGPEDLGCPVGPFHGQCGLERFSTPHHVNPQADLTGRKKFLRIEQGGLEQCCG
jgi:hypothetical protein